MIRSGGIAWVEAQHQDVIERVGLRASNVWSAGDGLSESAVKVEVP